MDAVIRSGGTVCPKETRSEEIADKKKVFGPRLAETDADFDAALDTQQSHWEDAQGSANGALLQSF